MKKWLILLIALVLVFAGCDNSVQLEQKEPAAKPSKPHTENPVYPFVGYTNKDYEELMVGTWKDVSSNDTFIFKAPNLVKRYGEDGSSSRDKFINYSVNGSVVKGIDTVGHFYWSFYFSFKDRNTLLLSNGYTVYTLKRQ